MGAGRRAVPHPADDALADPRQPEEVVAEVPVQVRQAVAARQLAVLRHGLLDGRHAVRVRSGDLGQAAALVGRHHPVHQEIAEVGQRIAQGRQLPVQHRHHARLGGVQDHVVQAIVAMDDRGDVVGRAAGRQELDQPVHVLDRAGLGRLVLLGPAVDLAGEVVAGLAVVGQADGGVVDIVQGGQGGDLGLVDRPALGRLVVGQGPVPQDPAFDIVHHVEDRADHVLVHAQRVGLGDGEAGLVQARDHLELAVDGVGAGQQLARRLAAQDVLLGRGDQLVGRVGLAALELAHLQRA
jgi:hypothetical protein